MQCLRCGNTESKYFYRDAKIWYCRKCISFGRVNVNELPERRIYQKRECHCQYDLKYPLTPYQKKASTEICEHISHHQSTLVYAVCGARKNRTRDGSYSAVFK